MATLTDVTRVFAEKKATITGKRVMLDFGEVGVIMLDGINNTVSNNRGDADTTIQISLENFIAMAQGKLNGTTAFMQGKLKVKGDMTTAMKFQSLSASLR